MLWLNFYSTAVTPTTTKEITMTTTATTDMATTRAAAGDNRGFGAGVRCIGPFVCGGRRQGVCLLPEQTFLATAAERPYRQSSPRGSAVDSAVGAAWKGHQPRQ